MIQRVLKSDRGTSVIEFALVAPVLVFMLIGLIDVGRGMYFGILAQNAARAGAAYGSQTPTTANDTPGMSTAATTDGSGVTWTVNSQLVCSLNGGTPSAASCPTGTSPGTGTLYYVKVQATGSFSTLIHYPGLPSTIPITGTSVVRVVAQ